MPNGAGMAALFLLADRIPGGARLLRDGACVSPDGRDG